MIAHLPSKAEGRHLCLKLHRVLQHAIDIKRQGEIGQAGHGLQHRGQAPIWAEIAERHQAQATGAIPRPRLDGGRGRRGEREVEHRDVGVRSQPIPFLLVVHDGGERHAGGGCGHGVALHQGVEPLPPVQPLRRIGHGAGAMAPAQAHHVAVPLGRAVCSLVGEEVLQPGVVQHDHAGGLGGNVEDGSVERIVVAKIVDLHIGAVEAGPIHPHRVKPHHGKVQGRAVTPLQGGRLGLRRPQRDLGMGAQRCRNGERVVGHLALLRRQRGEQVQPEASRHCATMSHVGSSCS